MLGKKANEHVNAKINSIIGPDMVLEGNISAKEAVRVEGTIKGNVSSEGAVIVSATGMITGNVRGSNIMIGGTIEGDMTSGGRIEVAATGRVNGNIKTKSLIIDENAVFQGQCTMNQDGNIQAKSESEKLTENKTDYNGDKEPAKADK